MFQPYSRGSISYFTPFNEIHYCSWQWDLIEWNYAAEDVGGNFWGSSDEAAVASFCWYLMYLSMWDHTAHFHWWTRTHASAVWHSKMIDIDNSTTLLTTFGILGLDEFLLGSFNAQFKLINAYFLQTKLNFVLIMIFQLPPHLFLIQRRWENFNFIGWRWILEVDCFRKKTVCFWYKIQETTHLSIVMKQNKTKSWLSFRNVCLASFDKFASPGVVWVFLLLFNKMCYDLS